MKTTLPVALLLLLPLLNACQPRPSGTAITHVAVVDAVNGVRENQTVIFDGDRITAVAASDSAPEAARTIDGTGKFLIPGLWDFHVHLTFDDDWTSIMPALFLSYGVTSVRDTGGLMHKMLPVVKRMRDEEAAAPRVFFAGPLLDGEFVVYDGASRPEIGVRIATPADARNTITELETQGVDFIKIYEMVSPEVFDAMVETANDLNLPIASHVPLSMRARVAGAPVDSIEHLRNIELDCASNAEDLRDTRLGLLENADALAGAELRASMHSLQRPAAIDAYDEAVCDQTLQALASTMQVPTLRLNAFSLATPAGREDWTEALSRIPSGLREEWSAAAIELAENPVQEFIDFGKWSMFLTGRMHAQGIPIAAGTDTPILIAVPGYSLHAELEYLVGAGLSPLEALASATVRPAEYFSLEDEIGTIDVGKKADLVLLDANPLDDIRNTKKISAVVTKGDYYDKASLLGLVQDSRQGP